MSEESHDDPVADREDLAALAALEMLNQSWADGEESDSSHRQDLERQYLELLGLIPRALEPVAPSAATKEALFAKLGRSEPPDVARVVAFAEPRAELPRRSGSGLAWTLAATLAAVSLGLALWATSLRGQLAARDNLAVSTDPVVSTPASARPPGLLVVSDLEETITRVAMPGVEVCPMRPLGDLPVQPRAKGLFYLSSERSEWMLAAHNLAPSEEGTHYNVWFRTESGVVNGGDFEVHQSGAILIRAEEIPEGTQAVLITLESESADEPTGPTVLYGDEGEIMG